MTETFYDYDPYDFDGDLDDDYDPYDFEQDFLSHCQYKYKNGKWCGRETTNEFCEQCGKPLCFMHMETGANFCDTCPTDDYAPDYMRKEEVGE